MEADMLNTTYVGILSLLWEDGWYLITYYLNKFSNAEVYYLIYNKELYAIIYSFK